MLTPERGAHDVVGAELQTESLRSSELPVALTDIAESGRFSIEGGFILIEVKGESFICRPNDSELGFDISGTKGLHYGMLFQGCSDLQDFTRPRSVVEVFDLFRSESVFARLTGIFAALGYVAESEPEELAELVGDLETDLTDIAVADWRERLQAQIVLNADPCAEEILKRVLAQCHADGAVKLSELLEILNGCRREPLQPNEPGAMISAAEAVARRRIID